MIREIKVKKINKDDPSVIMPTHANHGDAGIDLHANINERMEFRNGENAVLVPTGIAIDMSSVPEDVMAIIVPRSGKGHKEGMRLGNTIGIIDKGYHGQLMVSVRNEYDDPMFINPGERFAQLIFVPIIIPELIEVDYFDTVTERGASGFGASGK